jgi:hypothetical protein
MCPPILPILPMLAVAAAGMQVAGQVFAGQAASQAGKYNAQVATTNAQVEQQAAEHAALTAEGEAAQATQAAGYEEAQRRERARFLLADQRQRMLASGVDLEGSPLEVLSFNAGQYELDALAARYDGQVRSQALQSEADARRYAGRAAGVRGVQGAGMALLQGQTAAAQQYGRALSTGFGAATGAPGKTVAGWFG